MKTHKDLNTWKNSMEFAEAIYKFTRKFPKEEMFCLTQQLRKAAVSIPSNIAEGAGRDYKREFIRFLRFSTGSLAEVETQVLLSEKLQYINESERIFLVGRANLIRAQIAGLIKSLKTKL